MEDPQERLEITPPETSISPEQEIQVLRQKIEELESLSAQETPPEADREKQIRQEIENYLKEKEKTHKAPDFSPPVHTRDEAKELAGLPPSQQVGALISLSFEKGLDHAVDVAIGLGNPAILDELHDTLVDSYYDLLKKEGII